MPGLYACHQPAAQCIRHRTRQWAVVSPQAGWTCGRRGRVRACSSGGAGSDTGAGAGSAYEDAAAPTTSGGSAYDHPALYTSDDAFWDRGYWDRRFAGGEPLGYDWYRSYDGGLRKVITSHLPREARVLQVGVGTSSIQVDMAMRDGYAAVHSVDYSPVAIARQEEARAAAPPRLRAALSYAVADMRRLEGLAGGAFGGALDKGALDALLCGDDGEADAAAAIREIWRVLAPGAAYVMVTSGSPRSRLPLLSAAVPWASVAVYEIGQRGALTGPFDSQADEEAVAALPAMGYSHLAYVCSK
ncbi:hypothetical protein Rsub_10851 [Raphidocelis subcapitata]|uniref:Methyltransferase type 11 domain-containing protein n=1 Tax=Raphidocelis subcapitata TaxID=307507 RepID=A0A2V0PM30_9CHLO|nr:hypothetical protein Rsub_10851 [Raphidocelis subcapitata]|eukprot:GBF98105.1 hypothetical protein Rsub_10851 [Raphidocelis subcapitata]